MISKEQFDMMKDGAIFVNCARGGVVNEVALYEALKVVNYMVQRWMSLRKNLLNPPHYLILIILIAHLISELLRKRDKTALVMKL